MKPKASPFLLYVKYHEEEPGNWQPHSVVMGEYGGRFNSQTLHDVNWCKRDSRLYQHESGSGPGFKIEVNPMAGAPKICAKVYASPEAELLQYVKTEAGKWVTVPLPREELASLGYELLEAPLSADPLADAEESEVVYCRCCDDYLPTDALCGHVYWMDQGGYGGCGGEENESDVRKQLRAVFATLNEVELIAIRNGLLRRNYVSGVRSFLLGDSWLEFDVGGRWSDGRGGGRSRLASAPPDTDEPERGEFLVPFPVPGGADPGPVVHLGEKLTEYAQQLRDNDFDYESSDWMSGINWLRSLDAVSNCREAEKFAADCIGDWLAELTGFSVRPAADAGAVAA